MEFHGTAINVIPSFAQRSLSSLWLTNFNFAKGKVLQQTLFQVSGGTKVSFRPKHAPLDENEELIPRFLTAGQIVLDFLYRNGRVNEHWLRLYPREFDLLWKLAMEPGICLSKEQLKSGYSPPSANMISNNLAVHIARIRAKLRAYDLDHILVTDGKAGYLLNV